VQEIRNRLVSNRTFSHIAWHYGLQDTLKTNPDLKNRAPAMEQKTLANTFEAYLGAVVSASGEDVLRDYVDKLLQPEVFPQLGALQRKLN
jgi:dsRNA-specific ribonuclease